MNKKLRQQIVEFIGNPNSKKEIDHMLNAIKDNGYCYYYYGNGNIKPYKKID